MNLIEALQTGLPLRRPIAKHLGSGGNGWLGSEYVLGLITPGNRVSLLGYELPAIINQEDILANDWQIDRTDKESKERAVQAEIERLRALKKGIR